jgi:hypothetical protein
MGEGPQKSAPNDLKLSGKNNFGETRGFPATSQLRVKTRERPAEL